jgi:hypothetical protein
MRLFEIKAVEKRVPMPDYMNVELYDFIPKVIELYVKSWQNSWWNY